MIAYQYDVSYFIEVCVGACSVRSSVDLFLLSVAALFCRALLQFVSLCVCARERERRADDVRAGRKLTICARRAGKLSVRKDTTLIGKKRQITETHTRMRDA